jgi:hypothetical protein
MLTTMLRPFQIRRPKRLSLASLGFLVGFSLVLSLDRAPIQAQTSPITQARITEILEGNQVYIQGRQSKVSDTARANDQIRTGQARAQIQFNNNAIARLSRNSSLTVGGCGAQLQQGSVLISGAASACTSTITAAVRGTTYVLAVDDQGEEQLTVLEGEVEVTDTRNPGRYKVGSGQKLRARQGRILSEVLNIPQREYEGLLTGPLVRGYREDLRGVDRIERAFNRLFPRARFPLSKAVLNPLRGHFSLAILQDRPQLSQVIARITLKSRRANGFLAERFAGDYLYPINRKAQFAKGLNPSDRIVVRLFTPQDRLIGYSEFELLDDNAAVSIVLPDEPNAYGTVRTVIGLDADRNGAIDPGVPTYDYFSQIDYPSNQRLSDTTVFFQPDTRNIDLRFFDVSGLQNPSRNSAYPDLLERSLMNRSIPVVTDDLEPTITSLPRQLVQPISVDPRGTSTYEVIRQILNYRRR